MDIQKHSPSAPYSYLLDETPDDFLFEHPSYYRQDFPNNLSHLQTLLTTPHETFSQAVLRLIDEKNLNETTLYKAAAIDRRLFSKLRTNPFYQPSRSTALSIAIALTLAPEETDALLQKAGFILSDTTPTDIVIRYLLEQQIYSVMAINEYLFALDLPLI